MADRIQLNPKSNAQLSRRGLIIGGLQTAFIAALAVRMRKLQVEDASEYRLLADENRINIRLISILQIIIAYWTNISYNMRVGLI